MKNTINQKKILDFIAHFSEIAKGEHWVSHYDSDSDSFSIHAPKLSPDAQKRYVNDEFAFYFNPSNDVEGVFIEYFVSNFVAHHKDFKGVARELKDGRRIEKSAMVELNSQEMKKIVPELQDAIIESIIPKLSFQT